METSVQLVLIVAKCIVNFPVFQESEKNIFVLIVAKCIVNFLVLGVVTFWYWVLIVAKCIVNVVEEIYHKYKKYGINSSKVYCKYDCIYSTH